MKKTLGRWLGAVGPTTLVCALLTFGTGCGAIKAAANPKVAWAVNDPAPMSVVVRRADVAEKTSKEVDRLMTETPADDDAAWFGKVAPEKEEAAKVMGGIRGHELYAAGARVVAAEYWAKSLSGIGSSGAQASPAAVAPAPAAEKPAPVAKAAAPERKADKKKAKKDATASKPGSDDKAQANTAPAAEPAAEAATQPASSSKYPSLLAAIDKDLGAAWSTILEKKRAMGERKGQIALLEAKNDEKGISEADKKANKAKIGELEKEIDALEKEADGLSKKLVPQAKAAAQKTPAEMREKVGPVLVSLRQAVDDASVSAGAAAVRYPMAVSTMLDSAKQMATVYVADVIEEKTGKRPSMQGLQPGVTLEGGKVQVTLNGLSQSDLGSLSVGEVTTEVASRTTAWVKRATTLLGTIAATQEVLGFEDDVLGALLDGFAAAGWKAPAPPTVPDAPAPGAQPRG